MVISKKIEIVIVIFIILISIFIGELYIYKSVAINKFFSFPLDDPWIHLTFAKNLVEYKSFSYFRNENTTSGSTSPIYTFLIAILFIFIKDEFFISYIVGIAFIGLTVYYIFKLCQGISLIPLFSEKNKLNVFSLSTAFLVAIQPKLNLISVSGMETTMFIFLISASLYYYKQRNKIALGIFLGLTIWCRPDGFIIWIAIALDYLLLCCCKKPNKSFKPIRFFKNILPSLSIGFIIVIVYFIFNYSLSKSIFPNTFGAKIMYYRGMNRSDFFKNEVIYFFSSDEFSIIWILFVIGSIFIMIDLARRKYNQYLVYVLFIIGLILVYYIKLPFAHRFGRYLIPVIPFYLIISMYGTMELLKFISNITKSRINPTLYIISGILLLSITVQSVIANSKGIKEFAFYCKHRHDIHIKAGQWFYNNTPQDAIIATHDIGAIAFYSERKVIDIVGIVNPEVIPYMKDARFIPYINDYLIKNNVTYIAVLNNWFNVIGNKPVYSLSHIFETLNIYKFDPNRTRIVP